ncbi:hypothetical protein LR48_Vigan11g045300 [Vigna angularis]|uniref:Uncharacterized protein n=1 Tax=Phaseolus angularis TaxID=3914 RepID=A0A0L9VQT0_PHAAN|nr:hypothetical protein LR48_Vigan11g045300 [Vigna angularis]
MDEITKPARTDVRPANGRSSSEWTLVAQRTNVRRPATLVLPRSPASGRSPSEKWTFVQRTLARELTVDARPARCGRSSNEWMPVNQQWTLVQRDAQPARGGRSPSERTLVTQQ